jgi:hypothetical protein
MQRKFIFVLSLILVAFSALRIPAIGVWGFWGIVGVYTIGLIVFDFSQSKYRAFAPLFFSIALIILVVGLLRSGLDLVFALALFTGVVGLLASILLPPNPRSINPRPIVSRSKIIGKELPPEEVPEIMIADTAPAFIGSTTGKAFHLKSCAMAQNIDKGKIVEFNSKEQALQAGYSPHSCIK